MKSEKANEAVHAEVAVIAGGCFWGIEEILRAVPGVLATEVGYTGGWLENPTYHDTHDSKSGHAEAVRITFDPSILTFETLLEDWFFKLHDPTTTNRQGLEPNENPRSPMAVAAGRRADRRDRRRHLGLQQQMPRHRRLRRRRGGKPRARPAERAAIGRAQAP